MRRASQTVVLSVLSLFLASAGFASVLAPPANLGDLARISRTVVLAEAQGSRAELRGETPHTITTFKVLRQVAGEAVGRTLEVDEAGGAVGEFGLAVTGAPAFERGGRYLLFLDPAPGGRRWQTKMLSYGILREDGAGVLRPVPEAAQLHLISRPGMEKIGQYRRDELLQHLSAVVSGTPWHGAAVTAEGGAPADREPVLEKSFTAAEASETEAAGIGVVGEAVHSAPAACRFVRAPEDFLPLRWFGFETTGSASIWHTTPGQTGIPDGGVSAVQQAAAAWTNEPNSVIKLNYAGSRPSIADCSDSEAREARNEVIFNDPCSQIPELGACPAGPTPPGWGPNCCGQVAIYGTHFNPNEAPVQYDGENWRAAKALSVIVNNGAQCVGTTDFAEIMTHFAGHGLGFDHHDDQQATMYFQLGVHAPRGATLGATDKICASYAYHTFLDVPYSRWSWQFVEAFENAGIELGGCGNGNFCPTLPLNRALMAVFLVRGKYGSNFVPPAATGTIFADVPADHPQGAYIEQLFNDGLTGGCAVNPRRYCPTDVVTRAQMATFLVRLRYGNDYTPPAGSGTTFQDVPASYWAAGFIEQLFKDGGTAGCNANPPRYCPEELVQREQIATFLTRAFNLTLP